MASQDGDLCWSEDITDCCGALNPKTSTYLISTNYLSLGIIDKGKTLMNDAWYLEKSTHSPRCLEATNYHILQKR